MFIDIQTIAPDLFRLRIPSGKAHLLNCYLHLGETVTLIDTGWPDSAPLIVSALKKLGGSTDEIERIVLTHFHEDHLVRLLTSRTPPAPRSSRDVQMRTSSAEPNWGCHRSSRRLNARSTSRSKRSMHHRVGPTLRLSMETRSTSPGEL